ncbi:MAG: ComEC/Rec2 family competence protein [Flavisolibacter sp.]
MFATVYLWNKAPVVRLLIALMAGIVLQWHLQLPLIALLSAISVCFFTVLLYSFLSLKRQYQFNTIAGATITMLVLLLGCILVWLKDVRHTEHWIGKKYTDSSFIYVTLQEPLVEKANSFKALTSINGMWQDDHFQKAEGNVIIYFKKDSIAERLHYGSQIIFKKTLQEIKNAGNPGSFDYKRYSLFQGITHQVYLNENDFEILSTESKNFFDEVIFNSRRWVVNTIRKFINGEKEQGLAEALLIGFKDDLDKTLVQSYTNTGVVHIIAISGMHLALIYWLLTLITKPLKRKKLNWLRISIILGGLWLFSILAGAQASVIRSAVMFTCVAFAEVFGRRTSIFNTLSLSAFLLLCYNPFWLWDVGFQLSYAAVLSIVIFYKPIANWYLPDNKIIDFIWKTMAVSLAAQIFTTPISLYHFHQFPVLFLLTNVVAVPLSSLILFAEIGVCVFSFIQPVVLLLGIVAGSMIRFMNRYIERLENVSFALWNGFSLSIMQVALLLVAITCLCYWLLERKKILLWVSLGSFCVFVCFRSADFWSAYHQRKLIVYNVPKHQAIDLISGRNFNFIGDTDLLTDDFFRNFHIQPSRTLHRINQAQCISIETKDFDFAGKHIIILDTASQLLLQPQKQNLDILILSKNPKVYISALIKKFSLRQIVIDGSVPAWKARLWKKDCDSLHIPYHDVSEKGAFVMNL